ncbi:MAG TPA: anthranilate synthase component I [Streptosporangiaceae bacterium]|nr:anthranilate synthase component I [Streptosporangiaceae bacterium]
MIQSVDYSADFGAVPQPGTTRYVTAGGIEVARTVGPFDPDQMAEITKLVDDRRGGVFSSGMEYPGRYSRWHTAYVDPCIEFTGRGRQLTATALNDRGTVLLLPIAAALAKAGTPGKADLTSVTVTIPEPTEQLPEEQRSRRPTVFSAIREIIALFAGPDEPLALFGAFGYDLAFQFEPIRLRPGRETGRDLVLHLPDQIYLIDRKRETALRYEYEFTVAGRSTQGLARPTRPTTTASPAQPAIPPDPEPGEYAKVVELARERFAAGDLFEVVPGHEFWAPCGSPAFFYERLRRHNPAPYEFFINLGEEEYLVGASPEMYVRVTGDRIETCPISGTVARGDNPLDDAENIRTLLDSTKDESELTMCTDVDRNDKSRICVPGSVKVIGRRQIEMYSRLIHTVDHVEGRLRPGFDALDAFLTHMWAVTVTGAPKTWAMQFIEDHELTPRRWYGGAVGALGFDGNMNTGLTLRTAHIKNGLACVRTGATLLFDSDPAAEEAETRLKARALLEVLRQANEAQAERIASAESPSQRPVQPQETPPPGEGVRVLLVDHQDSFVHTLAAYFAEHGASVTTLRAGFDPAILDDYAPDLVVLSPGPGRPSDFGCDALLTELDIRRLPVFGVCLGLQAMVEHAGGTLGLLASPAHGKPGTVRVTGGDLLADLPDEFTAGRYHSLHATADQVGAGFTVTATTSDPGVEVVMAIENTQARRWGVQFHPESILTASGDAGRQVIANVLKLCQKVKAE